MLDADLAELFGVPTKRFNEQIKRNLHRFPSDFMFTVTVEEKAEVAANCDHLDCVRETEERRQVENLGPSQGPSRGPSPK
jgi:hypothetical protein